MLLETTSKFRAETEIAAKDMIEQFRAEASQKGYIVKKAGYTRKDKKAKGEIIATKFIVEIVQTFAGIWDDLE